MKNDPGPPDGPGFAPFQMMAYPVVRGGILWIVGLALLELLPYAGWISWLLTFAVSIAILRSSMWGGRTMPRLGAFLPAGEFLAFFSRCLAAAAIVVWPFTLILIIKYVPELRDLLGDLAAALLFVVFFFLFFLPAALVSLARGDSIADALTPALITQLIREKGVKYQAPALLLCVLGFFLMIVVAVLNTVPHVGAVLGRGITIWFQFVFARAFGVVYLLPREQRVPGGPANGEGEAEPEPATPASPDDGAAPPP